MKRIVLILSFLLLIVVLVKQPWQAAHPPNGHTNHTTTPTLWHAWLHDPRLSLLEERIAALEKREQRLTRLEENQQNMVTMATQENHTNQMAQLKQRIEGVAQHSKEVVQYIERVAQHAGHMEHGSVIAKRTDAAWTLVDLFSRLRRYQRKVVFSHPFTTPPHIMLGISQIDLPGEKALFLARTEEVGTQAFILVIETRSDSRVETIQVGWLAFPSVALPPRKKESGSKNTPPVQAP